MRAHLWLGYTVVDLHNHGILISYVNTYIDICCFQLIQKAKQIDMLGTSLRKYDTTTSPIEMYPKIIEVLVIGFNGHLTLPQNISGTFLVEIQIMHVTWLRKGIPKEDMWHDWLSSCKWHRASDLRTFGKGTRKIKSSKYCGCTFNVNVR